jgi:cytochrome c5
MNGNAPLIKRTIFFFSVIILSMTVLTQCGPLPPASSDIILSTSSITPTEQNPATSNPENQKNTSAVDGANLINEKCNSCHAASRVTSAAHTREEWTATVERMISHGANLTDTEKQLLIDYLAALYPK